MRILKNFLKNDYVLAVFIFLIFCLLRVIPEKTIGLYPIGFDTIAAYPAYFSKYIGFNQVISNFGLLHWLFYHSHQSFGWNIWLITKIWGSLLYGALVASFFIYICKGLKINRSRALIITLIFGLSLPVLRISWDLFRNELGLIFVFLFMTYFEIMIAKFNFINFLKYLLPLILFSFIVIVSHQLSLIILLVMIFAKILSFFLSHKNEYVQLIIMLVLVLLIFMSPQLQYIKLANYPIWQTYNIIDPLIPNAPVISTNFIVDYLVFLYGIIIVFSIIGLATKKNNYLLILLFLLLLLSLSPIIYFGSGFYLWDRWMYFLIIPLSYFAYYGLEYTAKILDKYIATEAIIAIGLVLLCWKPIAYLKSGTDSTISSLGLPSISHGQYLPSKMAENGIGEFNKPENEGFFRWFNHINLEDKPLVLENAYVLYAKIQGVKAPLLVTNYLELTSDQKHILKRTEYYYTINPDFNKNAVLQKEYHYGSVTLYEVIPK